MANILKPDLEKETPFFISSDLKNDITLLLNKHYRFFLKAHESISISAKTGDKASWVKTQIGDLNQAHVFEFFINDCEGSDLLGGLDLLIDYLDGVLNEFFKEDRNAFFPLDFTPHLFEDHTIWARHEFHNFKAESLASELLKKAS